MSGALPSVPSRGNYARNCEPVDDRDGDLPNHIRPCSCPNHTGVCKWCSFKITIGPTGKEYGHARATNLGPSSPNPRIDCPHRPQSVDPARNDPRGEGR